MTDPREIAERLVDELRGRGDAMTLQTLERALTAYGNAQRKAGAEDMRERAVATVRKTQQEAQQLLNEGARDKALMVARGMASKLADAISALPVEVKDNAKT